MPFMEIPIEDWQGLEELLEGSHRCRNCNKKISPLVSKKVFCLMCSLKYSDQINLYNEKVIINWKAFGDGRRR